MSFFLLVDGWCVTFCTHVRLLCAHIAEDGGGGGGGNSDDPACERACVLLRVFSDLIIGRRRVCCAVALLSRAGVCSRVVVLKGWRMRNENFAN